MIYFLFFQSSHPAIRAQLEVFKLGAKIRQLSMIIRYVQKSNGWGFWMNLSGFAAPPVHGVADCQEPERAGWVLVFGGFFPVPKCSDLSNSGFFGWIVWWILREPQPGYQGSDT